MAKARVSYANKDYDSLRQELIDRIPTITTRWTDLGASDLGMTLLELFCGVADMLCFYLDNQANEAYLPTARQRQNVINLTRLVGYRLDRPVAATTTLYFTVAAPLGVDVAIPEGTRCRASTDHGDVDFVTAEPLSIPAGQTAGMVAAVQGIPVDEDFTTSGEAGQRLVLAAKPIAEGHLEVWIDSVRWTEVRTFYESEGDDAHYLVETDALDVTTITLGDGTYGLLPPAGQTIAVRFLVIQGADGNLGKGLVTTLLDTIQAGGDTVALAVTNIQPAAGGAARESLEHARRQAPAELATLWRAVTKADYIALAEGYPGVAKAQVLDVNDCLNLDYYHVCVVIAADGGGPPSLALKEQVLAYLNERKVLTVTVHVNDPVFIPVNVAAMIHVYRGYNRFAVADAARQRVRAFLAFDAVAFGQDIHFSDLVSLIDATEGVSHVELEHPTEDVVLGPGELPYEGTTVIDSIYVTE